MTQSDLLAKAREIAPTIRAQAAASEAQGRLTDEAMAALRSGDLFGLLIPKCFGGAELGPVAALEVMETIAYADGSAGWVLMAAQCCTGMAAGYLDDAGAKQVFGGKKIPIIAGQGAANGRAEVEGNGYRLTGKWSYGSGVLHADYIHTGAMVYENGSPRMGANGRDPVILTFIVPTGQAKFEGNWDVIGLCATGSVDYSIADVFVPGEFTHPPHSTDPLHGGNTLAMGIMGLTALGHTSFSLGVGRRALDELAAFARRRPPSRGQLPAKSDTESFQEGYGGAEARYRAARALVFEVWRDIDATLARGDKLSTRQITLARLALNHVTSEVSAVCAHAYKAAGGVALRDSAIQRCFRDAAASTQHFLTTDFILRECGRELAGLAEGQEWGLMGLGAPH